MIEGVTRRKLPVLLGVGLGVMGAIGCGAGVDLAPTPEQAAAPPPAGDSLRPLGPVPAGDFSARPFRSVAIRASPGGRSVGRLSTRTRFGTPTALAVVARRGAWLAVLTDLRPNGRAGWIPLRAVALQRQVYTLRIDLSKREISARRGGQEVRAIPTGIGAPGTRTPLGRAGVTDAVRFDRPEPYGCCGLALTTSAPRLPASWRGGSQIAIHGTADVNDLGAAVSLGCLRVREIDARWLMRNIPAGALVTTVA